MHFEGIFKLANPLRFTEEENVQLKVIHNCSHFIVESMMTMMSLSTLRTVPGKSTASRSSRRSRRITSPRTRRKKNARPLQVCRDLQVL